MEFLHTKEVRRWESAQTSAAVPAHGDSSTAGRPHQSLFDAVNDRNIDTVHTLILSPGAR
ncbi:hypothetical protein [Streptomyces sp. WG7]|uniref:hypothetical protein n=1 Tax=Streptomyces sp. WG7 TaxID=3417650 RepID=UPI003CF70425